MHPTEEDLARLRSECPGAEVIDISDHDVTVVAIPPSEGEWKRYRESLALTPVKRYSLQRQLVMACVRFPAQSDLEEIFGRKPVLAETIFNELMEMAGSSIAATRKKL